MEHAGIQNYTIKNFRNFQMTEDRDVSSQIHDYHLLINDLAIEDIKLLEPFVATFCGWLFSRDSSKVLKRLQK